MGSPRACAGLPAPALQFAALPFLLATSLAGLRTVGALTTVPAVAVVKVAVVSDTDERQAGTAGVRSITSDAGLLRVPLRNLPQSREARSRPYAMVQVSASRVGAVAARNQGPVPPQIFGTLRVGLPPQELQVAFDTGSGNVLLPSRKCRSLACLSHHSYDSRMSTTSEQVFAELKNNSTSELHQPIHANFPVVPQIVKLSVGLGTAVGELVRDRICLGNDESLCASMGLVEATQMSDEPFGLFPYDGILGLGLPALSLGRDFNFLGNLAEADALQSDRFAVWFATEADGEDSEITFGGASNNRMASAEVLWQPISKAATGGLWQTTMRDIVVGHVDLHICGEAGCEAAFDTGTGVIAGPTPMIEAILAALDVQEDCANYDRLPMLGFAFGDVILNLEPADYVRRSTAGCFHQLLALDLPPPKGPLLLLGVPFLRRYYTIYDRESLQVGMALAKHKGSGNQRKDATVLWHAQHETWHHKAAHPHIALVSPEVVGSSKAVEAAAVAAAPALVAEVSATSVSMVGAPASAPAPQTPAGLALAPLWLFFVIGSFVFLVVAIIIVACSSDQSRYTSPKYAGAGMAVRRYDEDPPCC
mmetsp:Transcript_60513/g.129854  ORF Transcript_60513/g.129854 Transcript_60513/m.129854 type:complete len:592 (+) Transcript_60513:167-1942(+)